MQIRELETLARLVFRLRISAGPSTDPVINDLARFVSESALAGDLNVPFSKGIRDRIEQIMVGEVE